MVVPMGRLFRNRRGSWNATKELSAEWRWLLVLRQFAVWPSSMFLVGGSRLSAAIRGQRRIMLEAAVIAGGDLRGVDALHVGVLPTPAVAYLTGAYGADFGVMISASHNPMPDNGIKIFGPGGHKLDDATEDQIERWLRRAGSPADRCGRSAVSSMRRRDQQVSGPCPARGRRPL